MVGGFERMPKAKAIATVTAALDEVSGFVEAFATSEAPEVVFAKFQDMDAMTQFLRTQARVATFEGLHASRNKPPEVRCRDRTLNKIKRALCEKGGLSGEQVVLNRRRYEVFGLEDERLVELATVKEDGSVVWEGSVPEEVRSRVRELLGPAQ